MSNLLNTSKFYDIAIDSKKRIFDNTYTIIAIILIALAFLGYTVYYNLTNNSNNIKQSSSYYGKDLTFYTPLFNNTSSSITNCIEQCNNDLTCDGITYNSDTQYCSGTKGGIIRTDTNNLSAWVKPLNTSNADATNNLIGSVLVGNTKVQKTIDGKNIKQSYAIGTYSYSFTITIFDFYENYGVWRHVFHKGTKIDQSIKLNYQSWESLINDIPNQCIGVWISPFTNNMRIAITTSSVKGSQTGSFKDAFVQQCNSTTGTCFITDVNGSNWNNTSKMSDGSIPNTSINQYIEYVDHDLQNIPINTKVNFTINFINNYVEIFMNGKLTKTSQLTGTPNFDKSSLYVMNDNTFNGEIKNLLFFPTNLKLADISNIMALK